MPREPQLYRIEPETLKSDRIEEVDFTRLGFQERRHIQEWVAANPGILGEDLLIIGKEFSGFDRTNERLDLLAVDSSGRLVIIELKRDDTGADAHWQAIKYASYLHRTSPDDIVGMAATYLGKSPEETQSVLQEYLNADDLNALNALNRDQRIILASHRFATEVTSAALWLNQKVPGNDLITCITLTPYRDAQTGALYVQANTIIPPPGIDDYVIRVGDSPRSAMVTLSHSSFSDKLKETFARNQNDEVSKFLRTVGAVVLAGLPDDIRPDRRSRWAGLHLLLRCYFFWCSHPPWERNKVCYRVYLDPQEDPTLFLAEVGFTRSRPELATMLSGINLSGDPKYNDAGTAISVSLGTGTLTDDFGDRIAATVREFIQQITPIIDALEEESNETDV